MPHILLVEDNPGDVMLVQEAIRLSSSPVELLIASDGEQASQVLDELKLPLDFILLDVNLPKLDGLKLLECHQGKFVAPVVCFTGSENPEDKQRAMKLGACDYVVKPPSFDVFLATVQGLLERFTRQKGCAKLLNSSTWPM